MRRVGALVIKLRKTGKGPSGTTVDQNTLDIAEYSFSKLEYSKTNCSFGLERKLLLLWDLLLSTNNQSVKRAVRVCKGAQSRLLERFQE